MVGKKSRRFAKVALWIGIGLAALLVLVALGFALVPPLTRGFTDSWGATPAEVQMALPGDEFVASPTTASTKAIDIDASPALVYRLLLQMGYKRGGWYGWDWFYNLTGSSDFVGGKHAETIVPELQKLQMGDVIFINEAVGYQVSELSPAGDAKPGWMLLQGAMGPGTKPGNVEQSPETSNMSWAWFVYPRSDGRGARLVLRTRSGGASMGPFVDWLMRNPLDFGGAVFGRKTLVGIKRTAEKLAASETTSATP